MKGKGQHLVSFYQFKILQPVGSGIRAEARARAGEDSRRQLYLGTLPGICFVFVMQSGFFWDRVPVTVLQSYTLSDLIASLLYSLPSVVIWTNFNQDDRHQKSQCGMASSMRNTLGITGGMQISPSCSLPPLWLPYSCQCVFLTF